MRIVLISMVFGVSFCLYLLFSCIDDTQDSNISDSGYKPTISPVENSHLYGPILIIVDEEWLMEEDQKNYITIGLRRRASLEKFEKYMYDFVSLKSLSVGTYTKDLIAEKANFIEKNINCFKIEVSNNKFWIDLGIVLVNTYRRNQNKIESLLLDNNNLYFYHPKLKKWWGLYRTEGSFYPFTALMNKNLYKDTNSKDDIENLLKKVKESDVQFDIINNRTFILPSMKFYNEKFGDLIERFKLFSWYVEKEEVAPKNDEDE